VGGLAVDRRQVQLWDWPVGPNFVVAISDALERADRVVALLSAAYFDRSRYTTEEWTAAALHVPGRDEGRLVPVRAEDVPVTGMPAVLRPLVFCYLFERRVLNSLTHQDHEFCALIRCL
jgi:TIR domain